MFMLGKQQIEDQMQKIGHGTPGWNRPLLSTRELILLRDKNFPARTEESIVDWARTDKAALLASPTFHRLPTTTMFILTLRIMTTLNGLQLRLIRWRPVHFSGSSKETAEYLSRPRLLADILAH